MKASVEVGDDALDSDDIGADHFSGGRGTEVAAGFNATEGDPGSYRTLELAARTVHGV